MTRFNRGGYNTTMRSNRLRPFLLVVIAIVAGFLLFHFAGFGGIDEGNFESQRNAKLRSEMQNVVNNANSLSRLGATSTSAVLGKIRQYVHGIEVINDLNIGMYGEVGRLYEQAIFDNIYAIIDVYVAKLASGQKVNESLTSLTEAIDQLNLLTNEVLSIDMTTST